jgi:hypothetical protein
VRAWRGAVNPPSHGGGDRAGGGLHHLVADAGDQPVGGDQQIIRRAIVQDDAELVAGHAPEMVFPAQLRMHALGDRGDDLVGDIEAIGFVDATELIDRRQQEPNVGPIPTVHRALFRHCRAEPVSRTAKPRTS